MLHQPPAQHRPNRRHHRSESRPRPNRSSALGVRKVRTQQRQAVRNQQCPAHSLQTPRCNQLLNLRSNRAPCRCRRKHHNPCKKNPAKPQAIAQRATRALAQQVRDGRIRAYAVTAKARLAAFPDIPTVDEAGLPEFYINIWHGLWAPAGTPQDIIAKLNRAAVAALADPAVRERLAALGLDVPAPEQQTPAALGALQRAEIEKWWPIIKAANIKAQ